MIKHPLALVVEHVAPPGDAVTRYVTPAKLDAFRGADQETAA